MPDRRFPFPKSLYAVEDAIRFYVADKPNAIVLDYFSGSGTTAHAVMRLNRQDNGRRQSISVTNNEVGADEQRRLAAQGMRPGDPQWEAMGICEHITKARIEAAIRGKSPTGEDLKGDYRSPDPSPLAEGFEENAEFFSLTYERALTIASHGAFERIAPLLWMRAGSVGRRIDALEQGWDVADTYGVIVNLDHIDRFLDAVASSDLVRIAFVATDDELQFALVCSALPERVEPVRLYGSYLRTSQIDAARSRR